MWLHTEFSAAITLCYEPIILELHFAYLEQFLPGVWLISGCKYRCVYTEDSASTADHMWAVFLRARQTENKPELL